MTKLNADNWEEVVQDGLSPIKAEILCAAKMADIAKPAVQSAFEATAPANMKPKPHKARQLALKL